MRRAFTEAMIGRSHSRAARWLELSPETWRAGLLGLVLRATCILGTIVCVPSVVLAVQSRMVGVAVMDAVALVAVYALAFTERGPSRRRAALTCLVFYALGAGLMVSVGSISQIYLVGFSLLTTLLLSARWGLAAAALNVATMLAIGFVGIASPEMVAVAVPE